jgi:hypothetical protein
MRSCRIFRTLTVLAILAVAFVGLSASAAQSIFFKASDTAAGDWFGWSVAVSGDTMVVGLPGNPLYSAVYIFTRSGSNWSQQARLQVFTSGENPSFGYSVAISRETLIVGAPTESSQATGVNGDATNNLATESGAAYVFVRDGTNWTQQAYLKPSNTDSGDRFGWSVSVSGDTVVVGSLNEQSNATGVNGNANDDSLSASGAAYVFVRNGTNWTQQAYLKASNSDDWDSFGGAVAVSGDIIVVGARYESSNATGVNGHQGNNFDGTGGHAGAAYIFARDGTNWSQQAYLKASNTAAGDQFGGAVAVSGETVVVGAHQEDSCALGVNGLDSRECYQRGAAYVFTRAGTNWTQQAYLKANNPYAIEFGTSVAISGHVIVCGAPSEPINGSDSGAAHMFFRQGTNWSYGALLSPPNVGGSDFFGRSVAVSGDCIAGGARGEDSDATGINGNGDNFNAPNSGAAYIFSGFTPGPFIHVVPNLGGGVQVRTHAIADLTYRLERAPSVNGPWTTNATITALTTGSLEFHDTNAPSGQAFYRVAQQ